MNRKDLFESMAGIDDAILERSERRRPVRRPWMGAVAAVLALIIVTTAALSSLRMSGQVTQSNESANTTASDSAEPSGEHTPATMPEPAVVTLAQPDYPDMADFPQWTDYVDAAGNFDMERYDADEALWRADVDAQRQAEGYADGLQDFFAAAMAEFLAGAEGENRAISPLNVYFSLGMMAELAEDGARQEILDLLGLSDLEALRTQAKAVWNGQYRDDGATVMRLASSVWLDEGAALPDTILAALADTYYASAYRGQMGAENYTEAFRDWLSRETGGRLQEEIETVTLEPETVLALATTIQYQAKWAVEFPPSQTAAATFHAPDGDVTCQMMHGTYFGNVSWGEGYLAAAKPLENDGGTMWLILPDEGVEISDLLTGGALGLLWGEGSESKEMTIHLSMPKFDLTASTDLIEGLRSLGVTQVFAGQTPITKMPHAVRVTADEEGVAAAAYTVMEYESTEPVGEELAFVLDRPFLFVVTSPDGLPLFAGTVQRP